MKRKRLLGCSDFHDKMQSMLHDLKMETSREFCNVEFRV